MPSRQGKIALQLTQWVGGTIVALMGIFVVVDYVIQARSLKAEQNVTASLGAEGLKSFIENGDTIDVVRDKLEGVKRYQDYAEGVTAGFVVFDLDGAPLISTAGTMSNVQSEREALSAAPLGTIEVRRLTIGSSSVVAAVTGYETRTEPPVTGRLAYVIMVDVQDQAALKLWATRSVLVLLMIIGTMLAVRIPVRKFVVAPIDGLFMAAYAASRDDYRKLPACSVDNEFTELYEMFGRLLGHLSDTRIGEAPVEGEPSKPGETENPVE